SARGRPGGWRAGAAIATAAPGWATIPEPRSSTATASATRSRISASSALPPSRPRVGRTRRSPRRRSPGEPLRSSLVATCEVVAASPLPRALLQPDVSRYLAPGHVRIGPVPGPGQDPSDWRPLEAPVAVAKPGAADLLRPDVSRYPAPGHGRAGRVVASGHVRLATRRRARSSPTPP